jgi:hypothetical protein
MPASRKSDGSTKSSTKIAGALKRKASKVVKAFLPKKKRRGPTDDTVSLVSTSPGMPTQTSDNESVNESATIEIGSNRSTVIDIDSDTDNNQTTVEGAKAELGISFFIPVFHENIYSYNFSQSV